MVVEVGRSRSKCTKVVVDVADVLLLLTTFTSPSTRPKGSKKSEGMTHLSLAEASLVALLLGLGLVLVQQTENFSALVLWESLGELVDGRGDLEALVQDAALALQLDVPDE